MTPYQLSGGKRKILIADDSALNRELLAEMLGDSYEYLYAEDGEQLLQMLSEGVEADILLLDMHMPNMSGMDVPLRYNYDKPEKPRISRVFGYQARFFILFQTEKSSPKVAVP